IVIAILLIGSYLKLRLDFSRDKAFSLSPVSREAVRALEDNFVVKVLASPELPSEMSSMNRYLKDLLTEYQLAGKGRFRYEYIRTASKDDLFGMAQQNGLSIIRFQIYENDQVTTKEIIFGLVFEYQGKFDAMNLLPQQEPKLEYELTQRIQALAGHTLPEISVFRDSTYFDFGTDIFEASLKSNFRIQDEDLFNPLKDNKALLFTGVARNLTEVQLYHLDQYLMRGGKAVFLQDRIDTDSRNLYQIRSNVVDLLEHYGAKLSEDVVLDYVCDIRQAGIGNMLHFPMYPIVRGSDHPITRNIENVILYLASGISNVKREGITFEPLIITSMNSDWLKAPDFDLDPELFSNPSQDDFTEGPIVVGALLKGNFKSFFTGSEIAQADPDFIAESPQTELVVFGDKELVVNPDKQEYNERNYIVLNAIDYLTDRPSMIFIRSRHLSSSLLNIRYFMYKNELVWGNQEQTEIRIKSVIKITAIVLPPLLLIFTGLFITLRRKHILREYQ
ncbi:MAG TPA: Gldg family protein, partial [Candidatus Cloacimonadota bacterium]|nr:Gldg family protein [Candidatus Cloacimonadota bacterium]